MDDFTNRNEVVSRNEAVSRAEFETWKKEQEYGMRVFQDVTTCRYKGIMERIGETEGRMILFAGLTILAVIASVGAVILASI